MVDQRYFPVSNNKVSKLNVVFSTSFGRQLEYYTGMVFKIDVKSKNKLKNIINNDTDYLFYGCLSVKNNDGNHHI